MCNNLSKQKYVWESRYIKFLLKKVCVWGKCVCGGGVVSLYLQCCPLSFTAALFLIARQINSWVSSELHLKAAPRFRKSGNFSQPSGKLVIRIWQSLAADARCLYVYEAEDGGQDNITDITHCTVLRIRSRRGRKAERQEGGHTAWCEYAEHFARILVRDLRRSRDCGLPAFRRRYVGAGGICKALEEWIPRRRGSANGPEISGGHRVRAGDMQRQPEEAPEGYGGGEIQVDLPADHDTPTEEGPPGSLSGQRRELQRRTVCVLQDGQH